MKIDIYSHIMTKKYTELYARKNKAIEQRVEFRSIAVTDLEVRLRLMNRYPDILQVLTVGRRGRPVGLPGHVSRAHRSSSFTFGRFPYIRIPTR